MKLFALLLLPLISAQPDGSAETDAAGGSQPLSATEVKGSTVAEFTDAFVASFAIIVCSEIGDKTFFIAAILSMRQNPIVVFAGAIGALAVMTVLSVAIGFLVPTFMSKVVAHYAFVALFLFFGVRLIYDASKMEAGGSDELQEVEMELKKKDEDSTEPLPEEDGRTDSPCPKTSRSKSTAVFTQSFVMTFLAEWGDRSQVATIALGAAKNAAGVTIGAVIGHALCSAIACVGGKMLASSISERTVAYSGGVLFILFGATTAYAGVD